MLYASALMGLVASRYFAAVHSRQLLLVICLLPFRFWRSYSPLYDDLGSKYIYELLGGRDRFKDYSSFLSRHGELRSEAASRLKVLWGSYVRRIGRDYGVMLVVSVAFFQVQFWAFMGSLLVVQTITLIYIYFIKQQQADFFVVLSVGLLIDP